MDGPLSSYADAIASIESDGSGGYGALGPTTKNGDKAYGRYQVMGSNIPQWTKDATGTASSPKEFIQNPGLQDQVFEHRFGGYVNQYGNPQDAASAWFTGRPQSPQSGTSSDGYITGKTYVDKFNDALANPGGGPINQAMRSGNTPMADNTQPALSAANTAGGPSALFGGKPPSLDGIAAMLGIGQSPNLGYALRNAGASLGSANDAKGSAALMEANNQGRVLPTLTETGTDPFSQQKHFAWTNPTNQTMTPAVQSAPQGVAPGTQGGLGGSMQQFQDAVNHGVTGEALLPTLPKETAGYLKALNEGRAIPGNMGRAGPQRAALMQVAHEVYPGMDETNIQARQTMAKSRDNPSITALGGQIGSANTLMHHNGLLMNDIDDLEKDGVLGSQSAVNWAKQAVDSHVPGLINEKVQAHIASYKKHAQAVAGEAVRLTRGAGGSVQEVTDWKSGMDPSAPIAAQRASAAAIVDLMHGRLNAQTNLYNTAMQKHVPNEEFLSPESQEVIQRAGAGVSKYASGAKEPAAAAAPAGPAPVTIVNPKTNQRMQLKEGKWQPL